MPRLLPLLLLLALGATALCAHAQNVTIHWSGTEDFACAPGGRLNPFSSSPRLEVFGLGLLSLGNVGTTVHLEASCPTS